MRSHLKLLHTADVHLGAKFVGLGTGRGDEQRAQLRATFLETAKLAIEERVDLFLLAGDTFDQVEPSPESLDVFTRAIRQLQSNAIPVVAIAGTHDCLAPNRLLARLETELAGAFVLLGPERPLWELPGGAGLVQGVSLERSDSPERPLAGLRRAPGEGWRIGMAHASLEQGRTGAKEARFSPAEVAATGLDYLALGHWHGTKECSQGSVCAWYCGAPEMISLDEAQAGSVLLVSLDDGQPARVERRRIGRRSFQRLTVAAQDPDAVTEQARKLASPDAVLELELTGILTPEAAAQLAALPKTLAPLFFHVRSVDRTTLAVPEDILSHYPDTTVIGRFLRLVQEERATCSPARSQDLDQALQLGLALLQGREVAPWS